MMRRYLVFLLLVALGCVPPTVQAATFWVSKSGSNGNSCTAARSDNCPTGGSCAKLTLNNIGGNGGISCLAGGDTLIVQNGAYNEMLSDVPGIGGYTVVPPSGSSFAAATTIRAETKHGATLQVPDQSGMGDWKGVISVVGTTDFLIVDGFILNAHVGRPSPPLSSVGIWHGISTKPMVEPNAARVRFKDLLLYGSNESAVDGNIRNKEFINVDIQWVGLHPITGEDVCTSCGFAPPCGSGYCHGYYTGPTDTGGLIDGGIIDQIQGAGLHLYGVGHTIRNMTLRNTRGNGIWILSSNSNDIIYNNVVHDCGGYGIVNPYNNATIVQNTVYAPVAGGIYAADSSTVIKNNLTINVPSTPERWAVFVAGGSGPSGNLLADGPLANVTGNMCDGATMVGCTIIPASPSPMVNPAGGNFYPAPGSLAINAGVTLGAPYNVDKAGVTRPPGGYDIGALEAATGEPVATKLRFVQQPTTVVVGSTMVPAVSVEVLDATDTRVVTATNTVSLAIGTNPGGATLGGTTSQAASAGLATFSGLTLSAAGAGYTLAASSSGLTGVVSTPFTVSAVPTGGIQVRSIQSSSHFLAR